MCLRAESIRVSLTINGSLNHEATSPERDDDRPTPILLVVLVVAVFSGCATLPPGSNFPKIASSALAHPEETRLGRPEPAVRNHTNVLRR